MYFITVYRFFKKCFKNTFQNAPFISGECCVEAQVTYIAIFSLFFKVICKIMLKCNIRIKYIEFGIKFPFIFLLSKNLNVIKIIRARGLYSAKYWIFEKSIYTIKKVLFEASFVRSESFPDSCNNCNTLIKKFICASCSY